MDLNQRLGFSFNLSPESIGRRLKNLGFPGRKDKAGAVYTVTRAQLDDGS